MGLVYYSNAKIEPHCPSQYKDGAWDVNVAGAEILGKIHHEFGLPCSNLHYVDMPDIFRVPYKTDAKTAKEMSQKLSQRSDDEIRKLLIGATHLWGDSVEGFVEWVRDWQLFLAKCEGYDTDPDED